VTAGFENFSRNEAGNQREPNAKVSRQRPLTRHARGSNRIRVKQFITKLTTVALRYVKIEWWTFVKPNIVPSITFDNSNTARQVTARKFEAESEHHVILRTTTKDVELCGEEVARCGARRPR
jgi:hypothetical protein